MNDEEILLRIKNKSLDIRDIDSKLITRDLAIKIYSITKEYSITFNKYINDVYFVFELLKIDINSVNDFFKFLKDNSIKEKVIKYLEENGYTIDIEKSDTDLLKNRTIIFNSIKKTNNPLLINYVYLRDIDEELADLLINLEYEPSSITPNFCFTNEKLMLYFLKKSVNYFKNATGAAVSEKTIKYAFDNGYKIKTTDNSLLGNKKVLKYLAKNDPQMINYASKDAMDDKIASIAAENGFKFEYHGQRYDKEISIDQFFSDLIEYLEADNNLFLLEYPSLVLSTFNNGYDKVIFQEIIKDNKHMNYMIDEAIKRKLSIEKFRNTELINNEKISKYIFDNYFESKLSQDILSILFMMYPYNDVLFNLNKISILLNDKFINEFGLSNSLMIIKYIIIPQDELNIELFTFEELSVIKKLLDNLQDTSKLYISNFKRFINYFSNNKELLNDIKNKELTIKDLNNISLIITDNINCNKLNDIDKARFNHYNNSNLSIKDKVSSYLFGCNLEDINKFLNTKLNSSKIFLLKKKNIQVPEYVCNMINVLERLVKLDENSFNNIWNNINDYEVYPLSKIKEYTKNLYFDMYKENITDLSDIKESYKIRNTKVYEFKGEDFSFIIHSLNAFARDYKSEKTIYDSYTNNYGKSYLCTSFINQFNCNTAPSENPYIFGYNYFSKEQLFAMDKHSVRSSGEDNNTLDVSYLSNKYFDPEEMGIRSLTYNEIDFYRQDNNGSRMTPSCMIFFDKIEEKNLSVAEKLNIPVVVIHTKYYQKPYLLEELNKAKEEISKGNISKLIDYIGLSKKLNIDTDYEELKRVAENLSEQEKELFDYILDSYHIEKQLVLK